MRQTIQKIRDSGDDILAAAHLLVGMVRMAERDEGVRSNGADLELKIELTSGETETWTITIGRKTSNH
jgi:hypothetical protein